MSTPTYTVTPPRLEPEHFCYWLQGWSEINGESGRPPNAAQWKVINEHLDMVFMHVNQVPATGQATSAFNGYRQFALDMTPSGTPNPSKWFSVC